MPPTHLSIQGTPLAIPPLFRQHGDSGWRDGALFARAIHANQLCLLLPSTPFADLYFRKFATSTSDD